jgi:formate dehydrogenase assembly factor FdhD
LETVLKRELIHFDNLSKKSTKQNLLGEEPLSIRVEGKPYAVVMRTPGDEMAHVAGFCLTEGIIQLAIKKALSCLEELSNIQPLRQKTLASHAAAIYGSNLDLLAVAEDVGRHNALDKAIGKVFLDDKLSKAGLLVLSSRISYELVQKSARARIPIVLAHSRPTALAVDLAANLNMTLASLDDEDTGLYVFCGEHRLVG